MALGGALAVLAVAGLAWLVLSFTRFHRRFVPILLYHYFTEEVPQDSLEVSLDQLRRQARLIKRLGYSVVTLRHLISGAPMPKRAAVITADDGDVSLFDKALPLLHEFGYPMTAFVVVDFLNAGYFEQGGRRRSAANWEQIRNLLSSRSGLEIGCHSWSHRALPLCEVEGLGRELERAAESIERRLGVPANLFAYPYGRWNQDVLQRLRASCYQAAFTTTLGDPLRADMFQIAREPVYAETGTWRFALKLIGVYGFTRNLPPIRHLRERRWRR